MYVATYRGEGRRTKHYKSEKAALKSIRSWLKIHSQQGYSVGLMGPDISPTEYHEWELIPYDEPKILSFYNSKKWNDLKAEAFERYGNKCACCGRSPEHNVIMHVDHIKPRSKHPELELDINNLQILCEHCNTGKSDKFETDWRT
ncbi:MULTISPECIES: HNH endonuclease [Shewanella]|uniref:Putative HNH nuclease YajD n=1 Tax=Shewanella japonica TaxID=93973 RepID=A0ABN4YEK9_9GAMM|nr:MULTISPECIES: HNH endonuclease signature motif containing protein [Shewanella]ARD22892.1 HNH endonuclease [Shewanella japonica]